MFEDIRFEDFQTICRLCLSRGELHYIFDRPELVMTLNFITMQKAKEDDMLPKNVCHFCSKKLEDVMDFIDMCKSTNASLIEMVANQEENLKTSTKLQPFSMKILDTDENITFQIESNSSSDNDCKPVIKYEKDYNQKSADHDYCKQSETGYEEPEFKNDKGKEMESKLAFAEEFKAYECEYCEYSCARSYQLKSHMLTHLKPFTCNFCTQKFADQSELKQHTSIHFTRGTFECNACDETFQSKKSFLNHYAKDHVPDEIKHIEQGWECVYCGSSFSKKYDLARHIRIHTGNVPFTCEHCEMKFKQKSALNRHVKLHTGPPNDKYQLECYICEMKFGTRDQIEAHMCNVHIKRINEDSADDDIRSTYCKRCDKNFSLNSYLKNHLLIVHERQYSKLNKDVGVVDDSTLCSVCGKMIHNRKSYLQHIRSHSPSQQIKKIYYNRKFYDKNIRSKSYNGPEYQCWHCGKTISRLSNLGTHIRTHTGEKPYQCKYCDRTFCAWTSWSEHLNIHTGARPFECDVCGKGFAQRSSLRKHLRTKIHSEKSEEKINDIIIP